MAEPDSDPPTSPAPTDLSPDKTPIDDVESAAPPARPAEKNVNNSTVQLAGLGILALLGIAAGTFLATRNRSR